MFSSLLNLLFPFQCCGCKRYGSPLCSSCARTPLARNAERLRGTFAPFSYHDARVQTLIHRFKYQGEWALATFLADLMVAELRGQNIRLAGREPARSVLVPVPLHPTRLAERGYNQSEKLAEALSRELHIPVALLLKRVRTGTQQAHLSKTERQKNIRGAFERARETQSFDQIILVDDVVTTGATLAACQKALAPIQNISALTFAHQALLHQ